MSKFVLSRSLLSNLLGATFMGRRDLYDVFGYDKSIDYRRTVMRYRRQDIAARVLEAPADALWSNPPRVSSNNSEWDDTWATLVEQHDLWNVLRRCDLMSGMGEYSLLLVGLQGSSTLSNPVRRASTNRVLYLQPYDYGACQIKTWVTDAGDERFMLPETYEISAADNLDVTLLQGKDSRDTRFNNKFIVHADRVLHIAENPLMNTVYGNPRMIRVWNLLDDLLKVCGGTAETFWLTSNRGLHIDVDKDMQIAPEDEEDLADEIDDYIHQLSRIIRTRGVKINSLGSDTPDPSNVFDMIISLISAATGIPKRILTGSEAGQLASQEDRANWAERVEERRNKFAEPFVIRPFMRMLTRVGVLPALGAPVEIQWPDPFKLSPLERAQTSAQKARSAVNLAKALKENPALMTVDEARETIGVSGPVETVSTETPSAQ